MNTNKIFRKSIMLVIMLLCFNALTAQDKITFVWEGYYIYGKLTIRATEGETFTIDWGDETPVEIKTGLDTTDIQLLHIYDNDGKRKYTVTITASNTDCKFTYFDCCPLDDCGSLFQIKSFKLNGCSELMYLNCWYNSIPLSDLYAVKLVMNEQSVKLFGSQFLETVLTGGMTLDFSSEHLIGGVETVFTVWKYDKPSIINVDYSIENGIITLIKNGYYEVWLHNDAVPASFYIGMPIPDNIPENAFSNFKIYPNPTSDMVFIETKNGITPELKLYSLNGRLLQQIKNTEVDLSGYAAGVYLLSVDGQTVKIVKR